VTHSTRADAPIFSVGISTPPARNNLPPRRDLAASYAESGAGHLEV